MGMRMMMMMMTVILMGFHLEGHASEDEELLARLGVEGRVVQQLRLPHLRKITVKSRDQVPTPTGPES
jgi:hypothetical protein